MISTFNPTNRQALLTWTQVLVFASVLLTTLSPFTSPILVGGAFVVQAFWIQRDHGDLGGILRDAAITRGWVAIAAFIGYLVLRLFPTVELDAIPGLVSMAAFTLFAFGAFALFARQNDDVQSAIAEAFLLAFGVTAAVQAFEIVSGFALRRLLWTWVPIFRPTVGKIDTDGDAVRILVPFIANQTSSMLAALVWPVLLMERLLRRQSWQRILIWASVGLAVVAIFGSDQATSKVALLGGVVMWAAVAMRPRSARALLAMLWVISTLVVLPAAWFAYHADAYKLPLHFSARHRIVIWGVTAEKTLEHPLIGIGIGRTSDFDESTMPSVIYVPGTNLPISTNRHAHNVFLQAWYETGVIGSVLLMLAGLPIIGWIGRAPISARPLLAAAFAGGVLAASFSYSLLASWFLASFVITALFCRFALRVANEDRIVDRRA